MTQSNQTEPVADPDGVVADAAIDPADAAKSHPLTGDADVRPESPTFAEFAVDDRIVRTLADAGIEHTFAIQALTLPIALTGWTSSGRPAPAWARPSASACRCCTGWPTTR